MRENGFNQSCRLVLIFIAPPDVKRHAFQFSFARLSQPIRRYAFFGWLTRPLPRTPNPLVRAFNSKPRSAGHALYRFVGSLEAPGTIAVSAGLAKELAIHEAWRLRFESTFSKLLNHTNFAPPATNISNPGTFGVLTAAQTTENAGNRTG